MAARTRASQISLGLLLSFRHTAWTGCAMDGAWLAYPRQRRIARARRACRRDLTGTHRTMRPCRSHAVEPPSPESEQTIIAQLLSRLDRLEAEVAMWRAGANKGASNRLGPGQAESAAVTSRGQAFLPGYHSVSTQSTTDRVYLRRCLRKRQDQTRRRDRMLAAAECARNDSSGMGRPWTQRNSGSGSPTRSSRRPISTTTTAPRPTTLQNAFISPGR